MAISTVELHTLYLIPFRQIPFWSIPGTILVSIPPEFIVPGMAIWQNCLPNYIPPDSGRNHRGRVKTSVRIQFCM